MIRLSVIGPVLNEVQFIGYSVMASLPWVHEYVYALDEKSNDGTRELLYHLQDKLGDEKIKILETPHFHPSEMIPYNQSFNDCLDIMTGDAAWFLHPDMIVAKGPEKGLPEDALAWWVKMTSFAGDFETVISSGRCAKWKNIHTKKLGLHYFGGYGSQNEDFYHSEITGRSYKHYGLEFSKYPFQVADSGFEVNHYCELKNYSRRLEKMKLCLKTQFPKFSEERNEEPVSYTHLRAH